MNDIFSRTEMLIGDSAVQKLKKCHVAVFGVGGVGSYTVEALARCGIGHITLIDNDTVSLSNINRQLIALNSTVGKLKTDVAAERIKDINPHITVEKINKFVLPDNIDEFDFSQYDYIVDAVDTVSAKLAIIEKAYINKISVISSMGTGNKLDPLRFEISDIYKTSVCPLARVMRYELKKRGIKKLKVLYSKEEPIKITQDTLSPDFKRIPGSISYVPSVAGLIIAGEVIKDIIKQIPYEVIQKS